MWNSNIVRSIATALFVVAAAVSAAGAAEDEPGKTDVQCGYEFDRCLEVCETDHRDDAARRAPCVAACSGKYAACDAGVAYDQAKPWLEEQAKKTKRFFDDLMEKYGGEGQKPDPGKKTKENSI